MYAQWTLFIELQGWQAEAHLNYCKGSPFICSIFNVRYKTGRDYKAPLSFFGMCDFFRYFCLEMVPLQFFVILQQTGVSKGPKGSPFTFFGTMRLFQNFLSQYSILQKAWSLGFFNKFSLKNPLGQKDRKGLWGFWLCDFFRKNCFY